MAIKTHTSRLVIRHDNAFFPPIDCGSGIILCPEGEEPCNGMCVPICELGQVRDEDCGCSNCCIASISLTSCKENALCVQVESRCDDEQSLSTIHGYIYPDYP